jgi:hypothetical protein
MILAPIRAVAAWLDDATYGANAQITGETITLDGADSSPAVYAQILEETTSGIVALGTVPKTLATPACLVWQYSEVQSEGNRVLNSQQDGVLEIAIADILKESDAADGNRDAHYRIAAVRKSLNILHDNDHDSDRLRSNVQIRAGAISWRLTRPHIELDGAFITAGLIVKYNIRELNP